MGQILAAAATLGTLIFFGVQVRDSHRQVKQTESNRREDREHELADRRRERELSYTPYLSVAVGTQQFVAHGACTAKCIVNADGAGVAYNVSVSFSLQRDGAWQTPLICPTIHYLRAPASAPVEISWIDNDARQWARLEVSFLSMYRESIRFEQTGYVEPRKGLVLTEPPAFLDVVGKRI
jgi:hypothetical protein